jgi:hypothetical protein
MMGRNDLLSSGTQLNPSILNHNFISLDLLGNGEALSGSHVEFPAMPIAFNHVITQSTGSEWSAFVWTKVVGGIEFAVNVV